MNTHTERGTCIQILLHFHPSNRLHFLMRGNFCKFYYHDNKVISRLNNQIGYTYIYIMQYQGMAPSFTHDFHKYKSDINMTSKHYLTAKNYIVSILLNAIIKRGFIWYEKKYYCFYYTTLYIKLRYKNRPMSQNPLLDLGYKISKESK